MQRLPAILRSKGTRECKGEGGRHATGKRGWMLGTAAIVTGRKGWEDVWKGRSDKDGELKRETRGWW